MRPLQSRRMTFLAHVPPAQPLSLSLWSWEPEVLAALAAGTAGWLWVSTRFPTRRPQRLCGWAALAVAALALLSPLHAAAERSFTFHMAQHLLLMMVAAPLLALALPSAFLGWLRRRRVLGPVVTALWTPLPAFLLYHAVLFGWHLPALYDAALRVEALHALQHATFLLGSLALWGVLLAPDPHVVQATVGGRIALVLAANVLNWLLSFALALAERPLYAGYVASVGAPMARPWNLSPLDDLRLGGGVMWVMGNMTFGLVLLWLVLAALDREGRRVGEGVSYR